MLTYHDVRRALIETVNRMQNNREGLPLHGDAAAIYDDNGAVVGGWVFKGKR